MRNNPWLPEEIVIIFIHGNRGQ